MGAKKRTVYHAVIKTQEEYDEICETSTNGGKIAIIDCHLDWCGPCLPMVPNYQSLINTYDNADSRFGFYQFPESAMSDEMKDKLKILATKSQKVMRSMGLRGCHPWGGGAHMGDHL